MFPLPTIRSGGVNGQSSQQTMKFVHPMLQKFRECGWMYHFPTRTNFGGLLTRVQNSELDISIFLAKCSYSELCTHRNFIYINKKLIAKTVQSPNRQSVRVLTSQHSRWLYPLQEGIYSKLFVCMHRASHDRLRYGRELLTDIDEKR